MADHVASRIGDTDPSTGCWEWVGARTRNGYGQVTTSGGYAYNEWGAWWPTTKTFRAHRAVFMLHHERPIAEGMVLHHTCHRGPSGCVNPAHLVEVSQEENCHASHTPTGGASIRSRPLRDGTPRWAVLFREDGKQRSRTFATLSEAEQFAAERQAA